jgi:hypothetical protein
MITKLHESRTRELQLALKKLRILHCFSCFRLLHRLRFRSTLLFPLLAFLFAAKPKKTLALLLLALFVIRKQVLTCLFSNPKKYAIFTAKLYLSRRLDINAAEIEAVIASTCSPDAQYFDDVYRSAFLEFCPQSDVYPRIPLPFDPESMMELSALPFLDRSPDCAISRQQVVEDGPGSDLLEEAEWSGPLIGTFLPDVQAKAVTVAKEEDLGASFVLVQDPSGKRNIFGFCFFNSTLIHR